MIAMTVLMTQLKLIPLRITPHHYAPSDIPPFVINLYFFTPRRLEMTGWREPIRPILTKRKVIHLLKVSVKLSDIEVF